MQSIDLSPEVNNLPGQSQKLLSKLPLRKVIKIVKDIQDCSETLPPNL